MSVIEALGLVAACGAVGALANVFNDDGFHLPQTIGDLWTPGWIGTVFIGAVAAAAAWGVTRTDMILAPLAETGSVELKDLSYGLVIGFSGAKWLSAESDRRVLQKTAAVAAAKGPDAAAASVIATTTPRAALRKALEMQ